MVITALESGPLETRHWSSTSGGRRRHPSGKKDSVLRSAKGMTLPEVLVALAFIAVFSAGMATLAVSLVRGSAKAKAMDTAVFLVHARLEEIRNTPYANITAASFPAEAYGTIVVGSPA